MTLNNIDYQKLECIHVALQDLQNKYSIPQDDLKEIDNSFENIKELIENKIYYSNRGDVENHIERIDQFISNWQQHSKSLKEN